MTEIVSTTRKDRVRLVVLLHPKDGVPFEQFDRHWIETHGPLFRSIEIAKKNLLKYEQMHFNVIQNEAIAKMGLPSVPYYGMAIFEAESYEKIFQVFINQEYSEVIVPDEEKFFDRTKSLMIAGDLATFLDQVPA